MKSKRNRSWSNARPSGKISLYNPVQPPPLSRTGGVGRDIDRRITPDDATAGAPGSHRNHDYNTL